MVEETGKRMNAALAGGVARGLGAGRALGEAARTAQYPNLSLSILATAAELDIP